MSEPNDIVARLRNLAISQTPGGRQDCMEAADEIDALRARLADAERERQPPPSPSSPPSCG
jgi:hypothetical protein